MKGLLIAIGFLVATSVVGAVCFLIGGIVAAIATCGLREQKRKVKPVLEDPLFADVKAEF